MLAHAKLSKKLCAKALMTVMYVINRSPSAPLDGDIRQRVWTGKGILSCVKFLSHFMLSRSFAHVCYLGGTMGVSD